MRKHYFHLLLFPSLWIIWNAHSLLYWAGMKDPEFDAFLWHVYDSGTAVCMVVLGAFSLLPKSWQRDLSTFATMAYFLVVTVSEWSGHNLRGDILDSILTGLGAIIAGALVAWFLRKR